MTATQIAAEIARLSATLAAALADEDWDGDIAAVVGHLADAQRDQGQALDVIAEMAEDMNDAEWGAVLYETNRAAVTLNTTSQNLSAAADAARTAQATVAAEIAAAKKHLPTILAETRPSNVLAALGLAPAARFA